MNRKKIFIMLIVLVSLGAIMFSFGRPKPAKTIKIKETVSESKGGAVQQRVLSFNLEGTTQAGAKSWEVTGESAHSVTENEILLDNIVAKAYGNESEAVIVADKGIYDRTKSNVRLNENVCATIENTEGFGEEQMGISGILSPSPSSKDAKASPRKKSKTIITCDGDVVFDYANNKAYFKKNVNVYTEKDTVNADTITLDLDPATKKLDSILAEGKVKITQGQNVAFSEKASYQEASKKIVLSGSPKVVFTQEGEVLE